MFGQVYNSDNRKFCLHITIKSPEKKRLRIWAEEYGKRNSKYADREITVEGTRTIFFSFPVTPKQLFIGALNTENLKGEGFEVSIIESPLIDYNIWVDDLTNDFLNFSVKFSQMSGFSEASDNGVLFTTPDSQFKIKYYNIITDVASGAALSTPSRIGHSTGKIDVAKFRFDPFTIPMREMILLHEYSHKYRNPKINLEISNEVGADINALYYFLGKGFSKVDAICVFANVFLKAQTPKNIERMRKIIDYITRFENEEFAEKRIN